MPRAYRGTYGSVHPRTTGFLRSVTAVPACAIPCPTHRRFIPQPTHVARSYASTTGRSHGLGRPHRVWSGGTDRHCPVATLGV